MGPSVSINLCCYNSERYLRETLESIVGQTFKDWELVIIDDGSRDSTQAIIQEFINKGHPIRYHYQDNRGLGYSRNMALQLSRGRYIAFIDHDDVWLPRKLEKQIALFRDRPEVDFVYSNHFKKTTYGTGRLALGLKGKQPEGQVFEDFVRNYQVSVSTVVITRRSLDALSSLFDERFNHSEEYDLFTRLLYDHNAAYVDEPLSIYRIHDNMATIRFAERGPRESEFLMEKFLQMDPDFTRRHPSIAEFIEIQIIKYSRAKFALLNGRRTEARRLIEADKWYSLRTFLLYVGSCFPFQISRMLNQVILFVKRVL